jgi:hypothetical protein
MPCPKVPKRKFQRDTDASAKNQMKSYYPFIYCLVVLIILAFLLSACDGGTLTKSAQKLTGGNGAGLSEYQVTPMP